MFKVIKHENSELETAERFDSKDDRNYSSIDYKGRKIDAQRTYRVWSFRECKMDGRIFIAPTPVIRDFLVAYNEVQRTYYFQCDEQNLCVYFVDGTLWQFVNTELEKHIEMLREIGHEAQAEAVLSSMKGTYFDLWEGAK